MKFSLLQLQEYRNRLSESIVEINYNLDRTNSKLDDVITVIDKFGIEDGSPEYERADALLDEIERLTKDLHKFKDLLGSDERLIEYLSELFKEKSV